MQVWNEKFACPLSLGFFSVCHTDYSTHMLPRVQFVTAVKTIIHCIVKIYRSAGVQNE